MTNKATSESMETLHGALAKVLTDAIENGTKVLDKDGEVVTLPATAPLLNVARQFLKDNGIEADAAKNPATLKLAEVLPFAGNQD